MLGIAAPPDARSAYDTLAPHYDAFTVDHDHERWTAGLLGLARRHGLAGARVLDAGCGTGKSCAPLVAQGFEVTACDHSAAMLERARERVGDAVALHLADVRQLPVLGEHDLAWALCDVANYQLTEVDLTAMAASLRRNLAPGGVALFDCSTIKAYRDFFGAARAMELSGRHLVWHGKADRNGFGPGDHAAAALYAFTEEEAGCWTRVVSHHVQRHHPRETVARALAGAGLTLAGTYGQTHELRFESHVDEERHDKAIYVAVNDQEGGEAT
jgi:SAM-dependent methyltransferase